MLHLKILGSGCANCKKLEAVAREAVASTGVAATIEKVTDLQAILAHDILSTPALVINGQVVASGRIPTQAEMQQWLTP
ncbi:thioredoxin family protein [Aquabacterium sp. A08]|uniref:thioredoxin family protein n=1 Tax=Aquabacterium sp. A08 TaxID=2718532 RepID=UPI001422AE1D|nr:thioredoxin family protein [Aquabacterium sp. A08]NIC43677.1 thioredoxin family protein [Aquabacterium sp. A08]